MDRDDGVHGLAASATEGGKLRQNVFAAFFAQGCCHAVSAVQALLAPKLLSSYQYGAIQLVILYSTYAGFFHLGLTDGVFLRCSGASVAAMRGRRIAGIFRLLWLANIALAATGAGLMLIASRPGVERQVALAALAAMPLINAVGFLGVMHQAIGHAYVNSRAVIVEKSVAMALLVALLVLRPAQTVWYLLWVPISSAFSLLYLFRASSIFCADDPIQWGTLWRDCLAYLGSGIEVMLSNVAGSFVVGGALLVVKHFYGIAALGKMALACTCATFVLAFATQLSFILLPVLRSMTPRRRTHLFRYMGKALSPVLFCSLLLYAPISIIISRWIPAYRESAGYLLPLIPIVVFEGKMTIIYSTYMKEGLRQRELLWINVGTAVAATLFAASIAVWIGKLAVVPWVLLPCIAARAIVVSNHLARNVGLRGESTLLYDIFGVAAFLTASSEFGAVTGMLVLSLYIGLGFFAYERAISRSWHIVSAVRRPRA